MDVGASPSLTSFTLLALVNVVFRTEMQVSEPQVVASQKPIRLLQISTSQ